MDFHLAQFNVALLRSPLDSPELADFVARLPEINALAESAPGYVWRLQDESGNATQIHAYHDEMIVINLSVWETPEALWDFAYRTAHLDLMRRRREWFFSATEPYLVLWWVPAGELPNLDDAKHRLELLRAHGPTPEAFTFRQQYPARGLAPSA
jgi:hypothetical protein